MPISRSEARELMSRGYEMGARVLNGLVQHEGDRWTVDGRPVDDWLGELEGQRVCLVVAAIQEGRGPKRVCQVCGTEYEGYSCPHCRQVRKRLRGRA